MGNNFSRIIKEPDETIEECDRAIEERDRAIEERDRAIEERDRAIEERDRAIEEKEAVLGRYLGLLASKSWRYTAPCRMLLRFLGKGGVYGRLKKYAKFKILNSTRNSQAIQAVIDKRCQLTQNPIMHDPMTADLKEYVEIDISIVTFNSARWVNDFVNSVKEQSYPLRLLNIIFVDNGSTDNTLELLGIAENDLKKAGAKVTLLTSENKGFGAGHNIALWHGKSSLCLVTNIDLTFDADSLVRIVAFALSDSSDVAAWELRQRPYEHPKFYDPVTGITNWNSHACVLLRRTAFEKAGGYDETIFMYGEDVELSYRLRNMGYTLKYCPSATVNHYSYQEIQEIKPLQYRGSIFANLYLRFKFGNGFDAFSGILLLMGAFMRSAPYKGARKDLQSGFVKLLKTIPKSLRYSRNKNQSYSFYGLDYEINREGAWYPVKKAGSDFPLVSVITRTYQGREIFLRQAILSVSHQTYPMVEHIVVEDGGNCMQSIVQELSAVTGADIKYFSLGKIGRSAVGNVGLAAAKGKWCMFLDDDDLLFGDHIEILVHALNSNAWAVAAYTPAWQVQTDSSKLKNDGTYKEFSHAVPSALQQAFDARALKERNYMAIQSVLFEHRLYAERGGFDEDMDALEDWVLWNKYAAGNTFVYIEKVTSLFRVPANLIARAKRQRFFEEAFPVARTRIEALYSCYSNSVSRNPNKSSNIVDKSH